MVDGAQLGSSSAGLSWDVSCCCSHRWGDPNLHDDLLTYLVFLLGLLEMWLNWLSGLVGPLSFHSLRASFPPHGVPRRAKSYMEGEDYPKCKNKNCQALLCIRPGIGGTLQGHPMFSMGGESKRACTPWGLPCWGHPWGPPTTWAFG